MNKEELLKELTNLQKAGVDVVFLESDKTASEVRTTDPTVNDRIRTILEIHLLDTEEIIEAKIEDAKECLVFCEKVNKWKGEMELIENIYQATLTEARKIRAEKILAIEKNSPFLGSYLAAHLSDKESVHELCKKYSSKLIFPDELLYKREPKKVIKPTPENWMTE